MRAAMTLSEFNRLRLAPPREPTELDTLREAAHRMDRPQTSADGLMTVYPDGSVRMYANEATKRKAARIVEESL